MASPIDNQDLILHDKALSLPCHDGLDSDCLAQLTKRLLQLVAYFTPKLPGKIALNLHQAHMEILARILGSVLKAEPIDREVTNLEANIDVYVRRARDAAREAFSIPPTPFPNVGPAAL